MAPDSIRQERPVDQIGGTTHVIGEVFDRSVASVVAQSDGQLSRILYIVALRATVLNCRDEERQLSVQGSAALPKALRPRRFVWPLSPDLAQISALR
jgi:hypothetical protein